jgi:MFS family permease
VGGWCFFGFFGFVRINTLSTLFLGSAALGALLAGVIADYFGRRKAIMYGDVINTIGAIICCSAFTKWLLCTGVIFLGIATGPTFKRLRNHSASLGVCSHSVPLYISESCPSYLRGRFIVSFQLTINIGIMMAFAVAGIFSYIDPVNIGWRWALVEDMVRKKLFLRLLLGSAAVPSIIQWIGYHYHLPQTPRYTFVNEGVEECEKVGFLSIFAHKRDVYSKEPPFSIRGIYCSHSRTMKAIPWIRAMD